MPYVFHMASSTERAEPEDKTYPKALLGYRAWLLSEGELHPLHSRAAPAWRPGENIAVCTSIGSALHPHQAPKHDCRCGFNVYHSLGMAIGEYQNWLGRWQAEKGGIPPVTLLLGAVAGKGKIEIHSDGFRCESAQILALFSPKCPDKQVPDDLDLVADHYGVALYRLHAHEDLDAAIKTFETAVEAIKQKHSLISAADDIPTMIPPQADPTELVLLQCRQCGYMERTFRHVAHSTWCPYSIHPGRLRTDGLHPTQLMEACDLSKGWTPWNPDTGEPRKRPALSKSYLPEDRMAFYVAVVILLAMLIVAAQDLVPRL